MKLPRNISGEKLAKLIGKFGYQIDRQTGSHIRLATSLNGEHHITIPAHRPLRVGTLNGILADISDHLQKPKEELMEDLFG
jgi:predicted RNA binding protein YcfA (HicA-like mRNA interferase family)